MARKYLEHMLLDELELGNYPGFQRWYSSLNPLCYGLSDMNHDFRNVTRLNRYDLYSLDCYRQPYWMPQGLVFPNYEPFCFLRRGDRRGYHSKNYHFARDKRNSGEKRFYPNRQEDGNGYRLERRYQQGWNREVQHYHVSREDRNASRLPYQNSNNELCGENVLADQHLHNFKQIFDSRNASSDSLSVNENVPQAGCSAKENTMHIDPPGNYSKSSDVEWKDEVGKASKNNYPDGSQYPASSNFSNNYESWYCPEEQQQIIDMLKEVNLRHDRQLKRDMLLSKGKQLCSDESASSNNDSQTMDHESPLSSEEDEEIVILLSPGTVSHISETVNEGEEEIKSGYHEKSASDFFEEFQNIFTGSPEKKVINDMTKESLKKSQNAQDDDFEVGGRITDDDKNAVKTVLDFDNMDDLTEKAFDSSSNMSTSSPKEISSETKDSGNLIPASEKQNIACHDNNNSDKKKSDISKSPDAASKSALVSSQTHSCREKIESNENLHKQLFKETTAKPCFNDTPQKENEKLSPNHRMKYPFNRSEQSNKSSRITSPQINRQYNIGSYKNKDNDLDNVFENLPVLQPCKVRPSKENYNFNRHAVEKPTNESKYRNEYLTTDTQTPVYGKHSFNTQNKTVFNHGSINKHCSRKEFKEIKCNNETGNSNLCGNSKSTCETSETFIKFSNKNMRKEENGSSMFELNPKTENVVYKRISISEIFSSVSKNTTKDFEKLPINQHRVTHAINQNSNPTHLSPSEHLKQILGIGKNSENSRSENDNFLNELENEIPQNKYHFLEGSESVCQSSNFANKNECRNISKASNVLASPKYPCCMPVQDSETKENAVHGNQFTSQSVISDTPENRKLPDKNSKSTENDNCCSDSIVKPKISMNGCSVTKKYTQTVDSEHRTEYSNRNISPDNGNSNKGEMQAKAPDTKKHNNETCESQSTATVVGEENLKSKHKVALPRTVHPKLPLSQQTERNNTLLENGNFLNKSKKEQAKGTSSKYIERKRSSKDYVSRTAVEDSLISASNSKEINKPYTPFKSKLDSPKNRKKVKKKRLKEKSVEEFESQMSKPKSTQPYEHRQNSKESDCSRSISDSINKNNAHSPTRKKESSHGKSGNTTSIKYAKSGSFIPENPSDNSCRDSGTGHDGNLLEKSYGKALNSLIKEKNSEHDSNVNTISVFPEKSVTNNVERKPYSNVNTISALPEKGVTNNVERKPYSMYKSSRLRDNQDKYDYYTKGMEFREGTRYRKSRISNTDRYYPIDERKTKTSSYYASQGREQRKSRYFKQAFPEDKSNINSKECKHNVYDSNRILAFEGSKFKNAQNDKRDENREKHLANSAFKEDVAPSGKSANATDPKTSLQAAKLLDEICIGASSNATSINEMGRFFKPSDVPLCRSDILSSLPKNSTLHALMSGIRLKTQQMIEEAEKLAFLFEKQKSDIADLRKCSLKLDKTPYNYSDSHLQLNAKDNCFSQVMNKVTGEYPCICFPPTKNSTSNCISCDSLRHIVLSSLRQIHENSYTSFSNGYLHTNQFVKEKKANLKRLSSVVSVPKEQKKQKNNEKVDINKSNNLVIVVAPSVMDNFLRNKQALKLNHLLEVHVHSYLKDLFSEFNSVQLSSGLQNGLQLSLCSVIDENLFHTLPQLLNLLSSLSSSRVPWSRQSLKELLEIGCHDQKRICLKLLKSRREEKSQNYDNDILKCWDILSSYFG